MTDVLTSSVEELGVVATLPATACFLKENRIRVKPVIAFSKRERLSAHNTAVPKRSVMVLVCAGDHAAQETQPNLRLRRDVAGVLSGHVARHPR